MKVFFLNPIIAWNRRLRANDDSGLIGARMAIMTLVVLLYSDIDLLCLFVIEYHWDALCGYILWIWWVSVYICEVRYLGYVPLRSLSTQLHYSVQSFVPHLKLVSHTFCSWFILQKVPLFNNHKLWPFKHKFLQYTGFQCVTFVVNGQRRGENTQPHSFSVSLICFHDNSDISTMPGCV